MYANAVASGPKSNLHTSRGSSSLTASPYFKNNRSRNRNTPDLDISATLNSRSVSHRPLQLPREHAASLLNPNGRIPLVPSKPIIPSYTSPISSSAATTTNSPPLPSHDTTSHDHDASININISSNNNNTNKSNNGSASQQALSSSLLFSSSPSLSASTFPPPLLPNQFNFQFSPSPAAKQLQQQSNAPSAPTDFCLIDNDTFSNLNFTQRSHYNPLSSQLLMKDISDPSFPTIPSPPPPPPSHAQELKIY